MMRSCPVCNTKGTFLYHINKSSMMRCPNCQTQYTQPALKGKYGDEYTKEPCPTDKKAMKNEAKHLMQHYPVLSVLDYGSGNGYFSTQLPKHVKVTQYDPHLNKKPKLKTYDCIKLRGVIEHVKHPRKLIKQLHTLLKPNGIIAILTMDMDSNYAKKQGKNYYMIDENYHITYFTLKSLTMLLETEGFKVIEVIRPYYGIIPVIGKYLHANLIEIYAIKTRQ